MKIGIPKEIKTLENRVGITPAGVHQLAAAGHQVFVEAGAGVGSGVTDAAYQDAGATLLGVADVWSEAELLIKVKEPIESEYQFLRPDMIVFTYLHLAADQPQTDALMKSGATSIAYETVQLDSGQLPLLSPMSEVAGRMSIAVGSDLLFKHNGGAGMLLAGVPGVAPAKVVVVGAGVAGTNAAQMAHGLRADVTVLDVNLARLAQLDSEFSGGVKTVFSTAYSIEHAIADADLVIGSVLIPGARAPKLVTQAMIQGAKPGSVFVDIAVDQGGCFEGTRPTTHADPTFMAGESVMYCVANMPGAVPQTSTYALTNATLGYATQIANKGWKQACRDNRALARGLSTFGGALTSAPVAEAWGYSSVSIESVLA
ncbi:MAG: alanine dehydrogenase [Propionibacteriaceae bacterium]|jgi:alanine dehydrogenase|nr:alanine dehydrogenase [Propionibacteriaceae bacterium]